MFLEEFEGKIVIGEFVDRDRLGFVREYCEYIKRVKKMMGWEE